MNTFCCMCVVWCYVMCVWVCLCVYNRLYWVGCRLAEPHPTLSWWRFSFDFHCFPMIFIVLICSNLICRSTPQTSPSVFSRDYNICFIYLTICSCIFLGFYACGDICSQSCPHTYVCKNIFTRVNVFYIRMSSVLPILIKTH